MFFAALVTAFCAYAAALFVLRRAGGRLVLIAAVAVVVQLLPLGAPPLLSTDAWTYWEYGEIAEEGGNPYSDPPRAFPANPAYDHAGAAWRDTTSVYGPVFTLLSEGVARAAGTSSAAAAWSFKVLAAAAMLALTALAALLARDRVRAAAFVGWNPLLAVHFAGGGHNDALMLALVLGALVLAAGGRRRAAAAAWVLSITVKWVSAIFFLLRALEARASRRPVAHLSFAAATLAVAAVATWRYGVEWLRAFAPLAQNAETSTSYALPSRLELLGLPRPVALGLAGAALLGGLVLLARRAHRGEAHLGRTGCLLVATTPYLAPWYAVWAVPLAAADDDPPAQLAALGLCAYLLPQTVPL
ncbi:MAG TPA: polyprenol phosphomannose-dependent alpha 1,6 mannosyltransferase MptB [Gaiellaceae bacterium]|nr:polyprenol phosphomannose-dependent alpha 1,6 mannosyltransferase MptB [Gaiellaceae bacterium]